MTAPCQLLRVCTLALAVSSLSYAGRAQDAALPVPTPKPVHRAPAPKPSAPATNLSLIVLDPAHGGTDDGTHLGGNLLEKDFNAAFAERLKDALSAKGFTVVIERNAAAPAASSEDDTPAAPVTAAEDQRAEQANHLHPLACLLLHATAAGHGVHLFTSSLTPITLMDQAPQVLSWNEAQAPSVPQSLGLATDLSTALNTARLPLVLGRASVNPIDSLTCAAVAVELAPLTAAPVTDASYQTRVADAITNAMVLWRGHLETEAARAAAAAAMSSAPKTAEPPAKKPVPKKIVSPAAGSPDGVPPHKPAPIIRRPPEPVPPASTAPASPPPAGGSR